MSRIQQVLQKAERDGTVRRTRGVGEGPARQPAPVLISPEDTLPLPVALIDAPPSTMAPGMAVRTRVAARPHPLLVAATAPHSFAAERYRSLRTRIAQAENGALRRLLMMTSPGRGEGKSMTTVNLGVTMAQEFHRRIVVVDADLRRPSVHALLGLPLSPGLSDVLLGGAMLEDALVTIPDYRLTILPAGLPPEQPTELLGSTAMRRLLDDLHTHFDRILLDTPPVAPLADASVLLHMVDGVVVVVRAGQTPKPALERALSEMEAAKMLGLVLNDAAGPEAGAYGYDYGYQNEGRPRATGKTR
jgi:polysaccharide biosynthesis transport protein